MLQKVLLGLLSTMLVSCANADLNPNALRLPPGYQLDVVVEGVANARQIAVGKRTWFVGTRSAGVVYAIQDPLGQPVVSVIAKGLTMPSGLALNGGDLYVAAVDKVYRFPQIEAQLAKPEQAITSEVFYDGLPSESHHGWKFIAFGPDGQLYIPVGAPCNICNREAPFATIQALNMRTKILATVAQGVRNSVGFDWHPQTGELWFTDNGRDWLGDTLPPEELNRVSQLGQHFGYPFLHGASVEDPEFFAAKPSGLEITPPVLEMTAHAAPLGILFYQGQQLPVPEGQQLLLLAQHGSWNRSDKVGYRVMKVLLSGNQVVSSEPLIEGWLDEQGNVSGRPAAFAALEDGSVLLTDDVAGVIYRLTYSP